MMQTLGPAVVFLGVVLAGSTGLKAAEAVGESWTSVRTLMRSKGVLRQDLPEPLIKAHDRVAAARPDDASSEVVAAVAQLAVFVRQLAIDAEFLRSKQERLRGQVRNILITRPSAEAEREQIHGQLDRALELIANENYVAANAGLNDVAGWVDRYRNQPMAPLPAACRDPEPPVECRAWLPKPPVE